MAGNSRLQLDVGTSGIRHPVLPVPGSKAEGAMGATWGGSLKQGRQQEAHADGPLLGRP